MTIVKNKNERFNGAISLLSAALIFSTFGVLVRQMSVMYGDYSQVAVRLSLAFVAIYFINKVYKKAKKLTRKQLVHSALLGLFYSGMILLFTLSIATTKIANTVFLLYAGSIITALVVGTIFLKEKLTVSKAGAVILALVGVFMYSDVIIALTAGIILGIFSGVFDGMANSVRKVLNGADRATVLQHSFFWSALLAIIFTIFSSEPVIKDVGLLPILVTALFVFFQLRVGDLLLHGFTHYDVNVGTIILSLEIVFAAILGFIFFGEGLLFKEILGGILIFSASILAYVNPKELFKKLFAWQ